MVYQKKVKSAVAKLDQQVKAVTEKLPKDGKRIVIMHATPSNVTVELENSIAGPRCQNAGISKCCCRGNAY